MVAGHAGNSAGIRCVEEIGLCPIIDLPRVSGRMRVPLDELRTYSLHPKDWAMWLADKLGGKPKELTPNRLWILGKPEMSGARTEVLFALDLKWPDGERVLREARGKKSSRTAVVLLPRLIGSDTSSDGSIAFVPLDEIKPRTSGLDTPVRTD